MKVYCHYEGATGPAYTCSLKVDSTSLLEGIITDFCARYKSFSNKDLDPALLELSTDGGEKLLRYGETIAQCSDLVSLHELGDILVKDGKKREVKMAAKVPSTTSGTTPVPIQKQPEQQQQLQPPSAPSTTDSATSQMLVEIKNSVKAAHKFMEKLYYRKAREVIQECMKVMMQMKMKPDCSLNELMCELLLMAKKNDEACDYAERAIGIATALSTATSRTGSTKKYLHYLSARAHFAAGNLEDCFAALKKSTDELGGQGKSGSATASMVPASCARPAQKAHVTKSGRVHYPWFHLDVAALRAECLFAFGRHTEAADVVNSCMGDPNCESHMGVLLAYSSFAGQYGKVQEAIRSLLKVVVVDQTEKKGRRLLASLLNTAEGIKEIQQQLPVGEKSASAYGFLAMVAKDHSAIPAARQMLEFSLGGAPLNVGYLLNLMHVIELQGKYQDALDCCTSFLRMHGALVRVGTQASNGFSSADLLAAITGEVVAASSSSDKASKVTSADHVGEVVEWIPGPGEYERPREDPPSSKAEGDVQYGYVRVLPLLKDDTAGTYSVGDEDEEGDVPIAEAEKQIYNHESLDLLAIGFTVVKLLYLQGRLDRLPAVYKCIERSRRRSREPMHETTVRNEHAYYQCIAQVLSYRLSCSSASKGASGAGLKSATSIVHPYPAPAYLNDPALICPDFTDKTGPAHASVPGMTNAPLYVVGDSHVVPLAWSTVTIEGKPRVLRPLLTTGMKHYHLRAESDFYPKAQFANNLRSIPEGSDIMFVAGEIDCREGLLVALEKDQYSTLQEGMKKTIAHFAAVLPPLYKQRKMGNIYVHPVLPMLSETRTLVVQYNRYFEESMAQVSKRQQAEKWGKNGGKGSSLKWLSFFPELFQAGANLEDGDLTVGLRMDGTHISPSYLTLLEKSMQ